MIENSFIEYDNGSYIFLPRFVRIIRQVEKDISSFLDKFGAHEVIFPKIIKKDDIRKLRNIHERFQIELANEQLSVYDTTGKIGYLAHWQCEPLYFNLIDIFNCIDGDDVKIIYDNSGFSYRNEQYSHVMNFHEFKRIEVMFYGIEFSIRNKIKQLQNFLFDYLSDYKPILIERPEESYGGKEEVVDITLRFGSHDVEVFGSHIHFRTFIDGLGIKSYDHFITACCGISLSRISLIRDLSEHYDANQISILFDGDKYFEKLLG